MKRFHVSVAVDKLAPAVQFYSDLFGMRPTIEKPDYAKWMVDDPRVNFAVSARGGETGVSHLGVQAEDRDELDELHGRLEAAGATLADKGETACCYAKSAKGWVTDPAGLKWETFHTHGESTTFGDGRVEAAPETTAKEKACCA